MSEWIQHLPDDTIFEIQQGFIQAGLAKNGILDVLLGNIDNQYAGTLPGQGLPPNIRLLGELQAMNKMPNLRNGDIPLSQWLTSAMIIARDQPVGDVLDRALLTVNDNTALSPVASVPSRGIVAAGARTLNTDIEFEAMVGGFDDTLSVKYLSEGMTTARSVFKLLVHRHFDGEPEYTTGDTPRLTNGTGWLIAPGLLVTNHHVINARRKNFSAEEDASEQDFRLQAENVQILYDYHEVDNPAHKVRTDVGCLEAADIGLDFAILRLPDHAPERPPLKLRRRIMRKSPVQALGARVNVLQHPNGEPMRLGFRDNFVTLGDENLLRYLTDTSAGSSGSPVCDDAWNVAALHAGSQSVSDENIVLRGRKIKRENFGTPVPTLMAKLQSEYADLYAEITAGQN